MDIFTDEHKVRIFTERYCREPNSRWFRIEVYDLIHDISEAKIKVWDIIFKDYPLNYLEKIFATLIGSLEEHSPLKDRRDITAYLDTFTSVVNELCKRLIRSESELQNVASEAMFKHIQKMLTDKESTLVKLPFIEHLYDDDRIFMYQQLKMYFYCLFKFDLTDSMKRIISSVYDSYNWYDNKTSNIMSEYGDTMEGFFYGLTEEYTRFRDFFVEFLKEICEKNRDMWERSTFFDLHAGAFEILDLLENE